MKRLLWVLAMMMLTACSNGPSEVPGERGCSFEPMLDGVVVAFESGDGWHEDLRAFEAYRDGRVLVRDAKDQRGTTVSLGPARVERLLSDLTATHVNEVEEGCFDPHESSDADGGPVVSELQIREDGSVRRFRDEGDDLPDELTRAFDVASAFFAEAARAR